MSDICQTAGKVMFDSKQEAKDSMISTFKHLKKRKARRNSPSLNVYKCIYCNKYHLTKKGVK